MNARTLILAILNFEEATGYEIKKLSSEGAYSYFVDISYGSIYPTLSRLESEKLVTVRAEQMPGKPERKIYSITELGRIEFVRAMAEPPSMDKFKSEFLLTAMTAELNSVEGVATAIDQRIAFIQAEIEMIAEHCVDCEHLGTQWVGNYGKAMKEFDLEYLKKNRQALLELAGTAYPSADAAE